MGAAVTPEHARHPPSWPRFLAGLIIGLLASSGGFTLGLWDRLFPVNQPPTASIIVQPTEGDAPMEVLMVASGSDPEGKPLTYSWTVDTAKIPDALQHYRHTFHSPGRFAINVQIADQSGLVATASDTVTVRKKFDLDSFIVTTSTISGLIESGQYLFALQLVNSLRYSCGDSTPSDKCALLHALAAKAQLQLSRFDEGLTSIDTAMKLAPGDVIHVVDRAEFHLLMNESHLAISSLTPLIEARKMSTRGSFYLALAYAIESEYDEAMNHLGSVLRTRNLYQMPGEFLNLIASRLKEPSMKELSIDAVRVITCVDYSLSDVLLSKTNTIRGHIYALHVLVKRLRDGDIEVIRSAMGGEGCASPNS